MQTRRSPLKLTMRTIPMLLVLLFGGVSLASAQGVSAYFGLGSATDKSNGQDVDPPLGDIGPKLGGVFGKFGADVMFRPNLGVGGEYTFRFAQANYAPSEGVNVRPTFYDFNAIYHPISNKKVVPEFQGGIGGGGINIFLRRKRC